MQHNTKRAAFSGVRWLAACAIAAAIGASAIALAQNAGQFSENTGLSGAVLANTEDADANACFKRCQETQGCTGFQFAGPAIGPVIDRRMGRGVPRTRCTLYTGEIKSQPTNGVVSCAMPCTGPQVVNRLPKGWREPDFKDRPVINLPPGTVPDTKPADPPPAYVGPGRINMGNATVPMMPGATTPPAPGTNSGPTPPPPPRLRGWEVVEGPDVEVAQGAQVSEAVATCPSGKVALSAGYVITPSVGSNQAYGAEVKAATIDGPNARVRVRNANIFDRIRVKALAVCVNPNGVPLQFVRAANDASSDITPANAVIECGQGQRLIGGGFSGENDSHPFTHAPGAIAGMALGYASQTVKATPLPGQFRTELLGVCAPATAVPDWEIVGGPMQTVGGRSSATLEVRCPGSKHPLVGGFVGAMTARGSALALIANTLDPRLNSGGRGYSAAVTNRDIAANTFGVNLSVACATAS